MLLIQRISCLEQDYRLHLFRNRSNPNSFLHWKGSTNCEKYKHNLLAKITSLLYSISPNCLTRWGKVYGQTCTKSDPYKSLTLNLFMLDTKLINSLGGKKYCIELLFDASIFTKTRKAKDERSLLSSTLQWSWHIWKFVFYEDMQNGTLYNLWTMLKG